jgi:hypothetical protein
MKYVNNSDTILHKFIKKNILLSLYKLCIYIWMSKLYNK